MCSRRGAWRGGATSRGSGSRGGVWDPQAGPWSFPPLTPGSRRLQSPCRCSESAASLDHARVGCPGAEVGAGGSHGPLPPGMWKTLASPHPSVSQPSWDDGDAEKPVSLCEERRAGVVVRFTALSGKLRGPQHHPLSAGPMVTHALRPSSSACCGPLHLGCVSVPRDRPTFPPRQALPPGKDAPLD